MTIDAAAKHVVFCDVSDPVLCMPNKWPLGSQVTASQEEKIPKVVLEKMKYIETVTYAIEHFREKQLLQFIAFAFVQMQDSQVLI